MTSVQLVTANNMFICQSHFTEPFDVFTQQRPTLLIRHEETSLSRHPLLFSFSVPSLFATRVLVLVLQTGNCVGREKEMSPGMENKSREDVVYIWTRLFTVLECSLLCHSSLAVHEVVDSRQSMCKECVRAVDRLST